MTNDELFYNTACVQSEEQDRRRLHFDTIATGVLALSGALIGVMAFTVDDWACWTIAFAALTLVAFFAVGISTYKVLKLREWHIRPKLDSLKGQIEKDNNQSQIKWTAEKMSKAIDFNETPLNNKARWLRWTYICLFSQIVMLGMVVISTGI